MSPGLPDFTEQEADVIKQTLFERFGEAIDIQLADTELRLDPNSTKLTLCPAIDWNAGKCHFIINKVAGERFHCQFFYSVDEHFGTGKEFYDDIVYAWSAYCERKQSTNCSKKDYNFRFNNDLRYIDPAGA